MTRDVGKNKRSIRRHMIALGGAAFVMVASIGIMGAATDMSGAIISNGSLVVESSVKKVQHPAGGVVKNLLATEGMRINSGDLLIRLDGRSRRRISQPLPRAYGSWRRVVRACRASVTA
jgi:multidrug efflux pump subunit AcrA (membrane-fusion protein)